MQDQDKFLEIVEDILEIAKSQDNTMSQQQIQQYFSDMPLQEEQWNAIYQYLTNQKIQIDGYHYEMNPVEEDVETPGERTQKNRKLYQADLEGIAKKHKEIDESIIRAFLSGDPAAKQHLIENRLSVVVDIASRYEKRGVPIEEIIAQGNLGLMMAIAELQENKEMSKTMEEVLKILEQGIITSMESMIDEQMMSRDQQDAMLAKTNLIHEAAKYLTEEFGRVPTVSELSDYTHISEEEISQIMGLSKDAKRVAEG